MRADFSGNAQNHQGAVAGGWAREQGIKQALSWDKPQGWASTVGNRAVDNVKRLQMRLNTPGARVSDCDAYSVEIGADTDLYLVILAQEADGTTVIVGPRQEAPEIKVPAGHLTEVLGMTVYLIDPKTPTAEKFIV